MSRILSGWGVHGEGGICGKGVGECVTKGGVHGKGDVGGERGACVAGACMVGGGGGGGACVAAETATASYCNAFMLNIL